MGQQLWSWETTRFENLDLPNVKTELSASSWDVMIETADIAWGYAISLLPAAQDCKYWRSRLEVRHVLGDISPGIAFRNERDGILFQVCPERGSAELRYVKVGERTEQTEVYQTGDVAFPMDIMMEYDAVESRCTGQINGNAVFEIKLPFENIEPLTSVTVLEIVTTSHPDGNGGTAGYGDIALQCESNEKERSTE